MRLAGNHDRLSFLIPVIKIDCVCSMSMVGYVAMSSVVRMVAAAQAIPHAVMSSCRADGIITDYNTISHAVGWLVPDGWLCGHVVRMESQHHPPCG